ncbi:hypothetical protein [Francisella sp. SYW-9]|uniref:hypothetical protein n=1 Tax=Francisella sp. SYW-9 TaxID=2610888 RepID=UPI00123DF2B6|nr:hypothetical protein [Francisella sp. SYW-9]
MNILELKKIDTTKLKKLDLIVLLNLLYRAGFSRDNIIFESRLSFTQSGHLVEDVEFDNNDVKLILNMGILSANSALPDKMLDFFSSHSDLTSFNVLNAVASKLLKNQINMLLSEQSVDLKNFYLKGDVLFTANDNYFYSPASLNSLFERALEYYKLNVCSEWRTTLINKSSYLNKDKNFTNMHLGDMVLLPKLHFDITIQSETLLEQHECNEIAKCIDQLVLGKFFDANREFIAVSVWLIVHPVNLIFIPFKLSKNDKLMSNKIKIYERYEYGC